MRYYSTNGSGESVDLQEAVLHSFAPDGGVYMPTSIPVLPRAVFNNISDMSLTDIAYVVCSALFGSDIEVELINDIVKDTLRFELPMLRMSENMLALELFHGPTGTFKDIGARFLANIIGYFLKNNSKTDGVVNLLVATKGDTGSAVSSAFANMPGVNVFIFHPSGKELRVPEHITPVMAPNIIPVEVRGTLEDCQTIVRQAYEDDELNARLHLTSANSINIARLLPQTFFFFIAYARLKAMGINTDKLVVSMPCGNLGNLTAALLSKKMGLPIRRFMAAGIGQERLWGEMQGGLLSVNHTKRKALSTNLSRINNLIENDASLSQLVDCYTYNDNEIAEQISLMRSAHNYVMDRNTAMACRAVTENLKSDEVGVFLATAHPAMYASRLKEILGINLLSSSSVRQRLFVDRYAPISPTLPAVKHFLLDSVKHLK